MDEVANPAGHLSLQKEIDRLTALLQLSERRRHNQKIVYDKNLENLHEKLADFENILLKEQKDVRVHLQKKDQQIKAREDLASTLQSRLDGQYCEQCGYPSSKNKFDTDWEIEVSEEEKPPIQKLPPLSLPSRDSLPLVTFSNRPCHFKSKLSPVTEECEVAASSYLRNIHADQTPDRFHAVLTASLECLQVAENAKKNITPESETPDFSGTPGASFFNGALHDKLMQPRKLDLNDSTEDAGATFKYHCPLPSDGGSLDDIEVKERTSSVDTISDYANRVAISVLGTSYDNIRNKDKPCVKSKSQPVACIQSYSNNLAFGILADIGAGILGDKGTGMLGAMGADLYSSICQRSGSDLDDCDGISISVPIDDTNNEPRFDRMTMRTGAESKFRSRLAGCPADERLSTESDHNSSNPILGTDPDVSALRSRKTDSHPSSQNGTEKTDENSPSYSGLSSVIVPLVDRAMLNAKSFVRRRSSTNFLSIDSTYEPDVNEDISEEVVTDGHQGSDANLSFNRKTLIELIDQAVENVIPTVNGCKDKLLNSALQNGQEVQSDNHNGTNGAIFNFDDEDPNFVVDDEPLPEPAAPGAKMENKENDFNRSTRKRKSKKKKKKKKVSGVDDGARIPESVDHIQTASVSLKENNDISMKMDFGHSFDPSHVISSSLNNSATEISTSGSILDTEEDKFSLAVDQSFNEMEASRTSTPDTLDGFQ